MEENEKRELQQTLAYLDLVNSQIQSLSQQLELLDISNSEHQQALETITNLSSVSPGDEIMIPIGANNAVFATIKNPEEVFITLGSGIATILPAADATKKIVGRLRR